jgi:transcriptional regulator of acetoin/glycerol metabolism
VLCRAILLEDGPILHGEDFIPELGENLDYDTGEWQAPVDNNNNLISNALKASGGNKSKAAKLLGISRKTLYARLKKS